MKKINKAISIIMLVIWDIAVSILAMSTAVFIVVGNTAVSSQFLMFNKYSALFAILLVASSILFKCYNNIWCYAGINEMVRQFFAVFAATAILWVVLGIQLGFGVAMELCAIASVIVLMLTATVRFLPRIIGWSTSMWNKRYMGNGSTKKIMIIGAGQAGTYLAKNLQTNMDEDSLPVVFIDDDSAKWNKTIAGIPVIGGRENIEYAVQKYNVDEIIIAIPSASRNTVREFFELSKKTKCPVKRYGKMVDVNQNSLDNIRIDDINLEDLLGRDEIDLDLGMIREFIKGKTVLVTGGAGSIGSEICRQLLKNGVGHLVIFDFHENGLFEIDKELNDEYGNRDGYSLVLGSVRDVERLEEVFMTYSPDIIFHAAAHKHVPMMEWNPKEAIKNNVFGTINVAQTAAKYNAQKFILISTDKAVNPTNIMGASKRIAEMVIQSFDARYNTDFVAVRFGNVLGSNGSVIPTFKSQIEKGGPVTVTHKDIIRYFMTIPEAVQLVLEAGAMAEGGEIFVLDMGEPVKIYDLACTLIELAGLEVGKDIEIEVTGLRPGEKMYEEISHSDEDVSKTANDKIYVMKSKDYDDKFFFRDIDRLETVLQSKNEEEVYRQVQRLVPTFDYRIEKPIKAKEGKHVYGKETVFGTGVM